MCRSAAAAPRVRRAHAAIRWRSTGSSARCPTSRATCASRRSRRARARKRVYWPIADDAALERQQQHRDVPAAADLAEHLHRLGTRASVKKTSPNSSLPVICFSGRASTPRLVHVDQQHRDAAMASCASGSVRTSANIRSACSALVVQTFWPLTTKSSPCSSAPGGQAGEVGAGARLGEALAPDDLVAQQRPDDVPLLLVGADRHDGRAEEGQPERVDGQRGVGPGHLLVVDGLLRRGAAAAAVLLRPVDAGASGQRLVALPLAAQVERFVRRLRAPELGGTPLGGQVGVEPGPESVRNCASAALSLRSTASVLWTNAEATCQ